MANRNYGYQYETSPRKIEPEYKKSNPKKKKVVTQKSKTQVKKTNTNKKKNKTASKKKFKLSFEAKFFINSMMIFAVVFAIIACQALVEQRYKEKENLKKKYNDLVASRKITSDMADDVRVLASEYGMQTKSATLVDLGTSDYIESTANVVKVEDKNIFEKILDWIKDVI